MFTAHIERKRDSKIPNDVIVITQVCGHTFNVVYVDGHCKCRQSFQTDYQGITDYFYNLFNLLEMDDEPFDNIQFHLPGYPSILMNIDNLDSSKIEKFIKIMQECIRNFPIDIPTEHVSIPASASQG